MSGASSLFIFNGREAFCASLHGSDPQDLGALQPGMLQPNTWSSFLKPLLKATLLVSAGQVPIEAHFGQDICFWLSLQNNRLFFVLAYLVLCFTSDFYCSQEVPNEFLRRRKHAACSWNRDVQWELKKHCFFPGSTWRRLHVLHRKLLPWSICAFSRTRSTTVKSSSAQTNSSTAGDHTTQTLVVVCAQNSPSFHLVTVSLQPKLWENPEEIPCRVTPLFG